MTVRVVNDSGEDAFFAGSWELLSLQDGEWKTVTHSPSTFSCDEVRSDGIDSCCVWYDAISSALYIPPGGSYEFSWGGRLHSLNNDLCECGCSEASEPPAGSYMARVCAFSDIEGVGVPESLPATTDFIEQVHVAGASRCFEVSFDVPAADVTVTLSVAEPHTD